MQFSKRMDYFKPGIFSVLAQMGDERRARGLPVIDLSVGTPNIPPAQHIVGRLDTVRAGQTQLRIRDQ